MTTTDPSPPCPECGRPASRTTRDYRSTHPVTRAEVTLPDVPAWACDRGHVVFSAEAIRGAWMGVLERRHGLRSMTLPLLVILRAPDHRDRVGHVTGRTKFHKELFYAAAPLANEDELRRGFGVGGVWFSDFQPQKQGPLYRTLLYEIGLLSRAGLIEQAESPAGTTGRSDHHLTEEGRAAADLLWNVVPAALVETATVAKRALDHKTTPQVVEKVHAESPGFRARDA